MEVSDEVGVTFDEGRGVEVTTGGLTFEGREVEVTGGSGVTFGGGRESEGVGGDFGEVGVALALANWPRLHFGCPQSWIRCGP